LSLDETQNKVTSRDCSDSELSFPPDEAEIHLPDNISLIDSIHLKARILEFQVNQERAKELARKYRDKCSLLKTKLMEKDAEIMQVKLDSTHAQDRIRHFWRNNIVEGQSRSGRILRSTMCIGTMNV